MLEVRSLTVSYGRIRAVQGVSFSVDSGQIVAMIGANGAGKSSVLRAVSGMEADVSGEIAFEGEPIIGLPSHSVFERGIVHVPEGRMIFANLSVEENLRLGAYRRRDVDEGIAGVLDLFPILKNRLADPGASLSGGQAQMLALARAVIARPRMLLLDEPTLGLSPKAVGEVFDLIADLRARGMTIILVAQDLRQALAIADHAHIIESGRIVLEGRAEELSADASLLDAYIGLKKG